MFGTLHHYKPIFKCPHKEALSVLSTLTVCIVSGALSPLLFAVGIPNLVYVMECPVLFWGQFLKQSCGEHISYLNFFMLIHLGVVISVQEKS